MGIITVTIGAIRLHRTRTPCARPYSSIIFLVLSLRNFLFYETHFILDFCLWAPPLTNSTISDTEGEEVGWCTKNGYGTRGIVPGTFTGLQVLLTPEYVQYVGYIDQTRLNMQASDYGGELDPAGQDLVCTS